MKPFMATPKSARLPATIKSERMALRMPRICARAHLSEAMMGLLCMFAMVVRPVVMMGRMKGCPWYKSR